MSFGLKLARFEFVFDLLKLKLAWVYLSLSWYPLLLLLLPVAGQDLGSRTAVSHSHQASQSSDSVTGTRLQGACGHIVRLDLWQEIGQKQQQQQQQFAIRNCTNIFQFVACISQPIA